jgi:hypothetical protein
LKEIRELADMEKRPRQPFPNAASPAISDGCRNIRDLKLEISDLKFQI